jgi:hypothetical protein
VKVLLSFGVLSLSLILRLRRVRFIIILIPEVILNIIH